MSDQDGFWRKSQIIDYTCGPFGWIPSISMKFTKTEGFYNSLLFVHDRNSAGSCYQHQVSHDSWITINDKKASNSMTK